MILPTDSLEYEILERAAEKIKDADGLVIEFGTRLGGSAQRVIDVIQEGVMVCVDCYGHIPYSSGLSFGKTRYDYTNAMKNEAISNLYTHVKDMNINLIFINLEDVEFFNRYADGVPVYNLTKRLVNNYKLGFLDAGHVIPEIQKEIEFLSVRMDYSSMLVVDDIDFIDYPALKDIMKDNHFSVYEEGIKKASFIKLLPTL